MPWICPDCGANPKSMITHNCQRDMIRRIRKLEQEVKELKDSCNYMKTEEEILAEMDRVKEFKADIEINAVLQVLHWVLEDNVMAPADYMELGKKVKIHI